jgi:hypothetical protein
VECKETAPSFTRNPEFARPTLLLLFIPHSEFRIPNLSPVLQGDKLIDRKKGGISMKEYGFYIDGKWIKPTGRKTFATKNPANGEGLALFLQGTEQDVQKALCCLGDILSSSCQEKKLVL